MQVGYSLAMIVPKCSDWLTFHRLEKTRSVVIRSLITSTHLHVEVSATSAVVHPRLQSSSHFIISKPNIIEIYQSALSELRLIRSCTYPVRLSCSPKCLNSVISLKALRARMTLSKTLVIHFTATGSPLSVSCTEITRPYAPCPRGLINFHLEGRWNKCDKVCTV